MSDVNRFAPGTSTVQPTEPSNPPTDPQRTEHEASWRWVPIRSLAPRHRERISAHLLALDPRDRYLRFGYPATDAQICKYVDMLDFAHDEVFGIFSRRLELIALAHLAHLPQAAGTAPAGGMTSEFGVSVLPRARRRGFGRRLFERAMLHARNRGVGTLMIHALGENVAMLKLALGVGATVERAGSEAEAYLKLPPDSLGSHVDEMVETRAAELDYRLKRHNRRVSSLLEMFADVKQGVGSTHRIAEE